MTAIRIDRVAPPDRLPPVLAAGGLNKPVTGHTGSSPALEINGWVIGSELAVKTVEVVHRGRVIRSIPVNLERPDVTSKHSDRPGADRPGFAGLLSTLGLPTEFSLDIRAVLEDGERARMTLLEGSRTLARTKFEPSYSPLIMTALGRTGSTWMMNLLAAHPQIVVGRWYPFECRTAKYWLQVLKRLSEPATQPDAVGKFHAGAWWVGPNPYFEWDLIRGSSVDDALFIERTAEFCQRNIESWYQAVAESQGKKGVRYFSEKFVPEDMLPPLAREIYPNAKEIFLVRDFRDVICSILAFDEKRGFSGFGRREDESPEAYIRRVGKSALSFHHDWELRKDSSYLVRYEDLILEPTGTLKGLSDFLGLESSARTIEVLLEEAERESRSYRAHRTSGSVRTSMGRWKRELDPEVQEIVRHAFEAALEGFGYSLDDVSVPPGT
ncbi:MAG: sulfotransferase family protein [Gemmatimonadota bacterium]